MRNVFRYTENNNVALNSVASLKPQLPRRRNEGLDRISFYLGVALLRVVRFTRLFNAIL